MSTLLAKRTMYLLVGSFLFLAGWLVGQKKGTTEKTVLHVVAYATVEGAKQQDFENFKKGTADLVGTLPGLRRAWVGELRRPLVQGDITRTYGLVFEFDDVKAREAALGYNTPVAWAKLRDKVRVSDIKLSFDVVGE